MKQFTRTIKTCAIDIEVIADALDSHMRDEYADDLTRISQILHNIHYILTEGGQKETTDEN